MIRASVIATTFLVALSSAAAEPFTIDVTEVTPALDQRSNQPVITFQMSAASVRRFAQVTAGNVGRRMEIRIDGFIVAEPVIREPVLGGRVQISDRAWTPELAEELAGRLRSGKTRLEFEVVDARPPADFR